METPRYFQWQNESLVKTIYPLREMKLRDFLYFYQEIDLWKEYKDKTLEDIQDDIRAYYETQARILKEAVEDYTRLRNYFLLEDVRPVYQKKFGQVDDNEIKKINLIHASFAKYFPKLSDPRRERYFIAAQVTLLEPHRKEISQHIAQRIRRLNAIALMKV